MSKAIIGAASRISDYFDKQAIREKEKRKEKILSILPSFIEQQVSGITDKQTLFKTIPKLSADLYAYGPDIGNAANQILGNIAQTKYREIAETESMKEAQDTANIITQSLGNKPVEFNNQITDMTNILNQFNKQGIPLTTSSKMLEGIVERGAFKRKGIVEDTGKDVFFKEYDINNLGTQKVVNSFKVDRKTGTMDNLITPEDDKLPLAPEVIDWQNKIVENERNAKQQLSKSITLAKFNQDYQFKKMEEMDLNKIRGLKYYDMDTNEQVKVDKDKSGTPYFYTEKDEEIDIFRAGGKVQKVKTGNKVRVPYTKGFDKLQEIGQFKPSGPSIGSMNSQANLELTRLATSLVAKGYVEDSKLRIMTTDDYGNQVPSKYYSPDLVRQVLDEVDDPSYESQWGLIQSLIDQTREKIPGQQPTTTTKQKLPGWK